MYTGGFRSLFAAYLYFCDWAGWQIGEGCLVEQWCGWVVMNSQADWAFMRLIVCARRPLLFSSRAGFSFALGSGLGNESQESFPRKQNTQGLFGKKNRTVPSGDRFSCENGLPSISRGRKRAICMGKCNGAAVSKKAPAFSARNWCKPPRRLRGLDHACISYSNNVISIK